MLRKLSLLAAAVVLSGCAATSSGGGKGAESGYFGGATKGKLACKKPGCDIEIKPACSPSTLICGGTLDFDPIGLVRNNDNLKVTWKLPPGFVFCPQRGDGVFLKDENSDQFDPEEDKAKRCKPTFTLHAKNTVPRPNAPYKYKIVFRFEKDNSVYIIDPWMVNGEDPVMP